jgi:hypothetical protein
MKHCHRLQNGILCHLFVSHLTERDGETEQHQQNGNRRALVSLHNSSLQI